jgi:hypothetical protein
VTLPLEAILLANEKDLVSQLAPAHIVARQFCIAACRQGKTKPLELHPVDCKNTIPGLAVGWRSAICTGAVALRAIYRHSTAWRRRA